MVRDFIHSHQSHSPYFLQISEEFLGYLKDERQVQALDPAFMLKLAHYEWVELALDVSTLKIPEEQPEVVSEETSEATPENHPDNTKVLDNIPLVSPTAWRFFVPILSPQNRPAVSTSRSWPQSHSPHRLSQPRSASSFYGIEPPNPAVARHSGYSATQWPRGYS